MYRAEALARVLLLRDEPLGEATMKLRESLGGTCTQKVVSILARGGAGEFRSTPPDLCEGRGGRELHRRARARDYGNPWLQRRFFLGGVLAYDNS